MNKLLFAQIAVITSLILSSCGTSNQVVSNKLISKRKYTKGFFINTKDHKNGSNDEIAAKEEKAETNNNKSAEEVILTQAESVTGKENHQQANTGSDNSILNDKQSVSNDNKSTDESFASNRKNNSQFFKGSSLKAENLFKYGKKPIHNSKKSVKHIAKKASSDNSFMQILLIVILVVLLIAIFSFLDSALGGTLSLILGIIVLAFLIWLVLRLLGVI